jgi:hypothetical protein
VSIYTFSQKLIPVQEYVYSLCLQTACVPQPRQLHCPNIPMHYVMICALVLHTFTCVEWIKIMVVITHHVQLRL